MSVGSKHKGEFRLSCVCLWNDLPYLQHSQFGPDLECRTPIPHLQLDLVNVTQKNTKTQQQERFEICIKISASHPPTVILTWKHMKWKALSYLVHTPFAADLI